MIDYSQHYRILWLEIYDKKLKFFLIPTSAHFLEIFFFLKIIFFHVYIIYSGRFSYGVYVLYKTLKNVIVTETHLLW